MSAGSVPAVAAPSWRLIVTLDRQDIVSDCKAAEATDLRPDLAIMGPRTSARACSKPEKAADLRLGSSGRGQRDKTKRWGGCGSPSSCSRGAWPLAAPRWATPIRLWPRGSSIEFLKGRECKDEGYITAHLNVSRNVRPPQNIQLIKTITVPLQTNERTLCYHK